MLQTIKHQTGSMTTPMFPRRPPSSIQHHGGKEYAAKNLFMLAVGILNLPTSSASVERSFSQHSNIINNRLLMHKNIHQALKLDQEVFDSKFKTRWLIACAEKEIK